MHTRLAYRLLDRPGGRALLGRAATFAARRETSDDVSIFWDGHAWMYRCGDEYHPGFGPFRFLHGPQFRELFEAERRVTHDMWLRAYVPQPGDVVVDAGASVGTEAAEFSRLVGSTGRVVSIEANPVTFVQLERRVHWNGFANVVPVNAALVGEDDRTVYIEHRLDAYERNTVFYEPRPGTLPVRAATLDRLCSDLGVERIALLKLNIEGAEAAALDGMTRMIERTEAVCIACHDFRSAETGTREPVEAFLTAHGFETWRRDDDPRPFVRDHVHGRRRGPLQSPYAKRGKSLMERE